MPNKTVLLVMVFVLLLLSALNPARAQTPANNSVPLSFTQSMRLAQGTAQIGANGTSITVNTTSQLKFTENMILLSTSSNKYVERGTTSTIQVESLNAVSVMQFKSNTTINLAWCVSTPFGNSCLSRSIALQETDLNYVLSSPIGESQTAKLGKVLIYTGTIPVLGAEVSLFMRPVVSWTPTLSGMLAIAGPASASPNSLAWTTDSTSTQLTFSDTKPVSLSLTNPQLNLQNFRVSLQFPAIVTLVPVTPLASVDVTTLGSYQIAADTPSINLISFDPNYDNLIVSLKAELDRAIANGSVSRLSSIPGQVDALARQVNALNQSFTQTSKGLASSLNMLSQNVASFEAQTNKGLANATQNLKSFESQADGQLSLLGSKLESDTSAINQLQYAVLAVVAFSMVATFTYIYRHRKHA